MTKTVGASVLSRAVDQVDSAHQIIQDEIKRLEAGMSTTGRPRKLTSGVTSHLQDIATRLEVRLFTNRNVQARIRRVIKQNEENIKNYGTSR